MVAVPPLRLVHPPVKSYLVVRHTCIIKCQNLFQGSQDGYFDQVGIIGVFLAILLLLGAAGGLGLELFRIRHGCEEWGGGRK